MGVFQKAGHATYPGKLTLVVMLSFLQLVQGVALNILHLDLAPQFPSQYINKSFVPEFR